MANPIAALNDAFRHRVPFAPGGRVVLTRTVASLPPEQVVTIVAAVRSFNAFTRNNDPHGEHDCAVIQVAGESVIFKFDYYENDQCEYGAESGLDCFRVLTIMLSSDY